VSRKTLALIGVFIATMVLDQATKAWVYTQISPGSPGIEVIPHLFSIVHAQNPGAVAGILKGYTWLFLIFTGVALYLVWSMWRKVEANEGMLPSILGLILGGALGNAVDRVHKGTVTDFLRVYSDAPAVVAKVQALFGDWAGGGRVVEWPTFNVADMALVVGVIAYVGYTMKYGEPEGPVTAEEPPPTPDGAESAGTTPESAPPAAPPAS
jgi:signal peptidase II